MCTAPVEASEDKIDKILDRISQEHDYPGVSLAVSYDDKVYFKQIGYADIAIGSSVNNKTIFRMYSLTKGVTEILANLLVKNGSLDLELPVSFYLPNIPIHLQKITVQHLLSHKSGILDKNNKKHDKENVHSYYTLGNSFSQTLVLIGV